jgi:hypothetical protein
MLPHEKELVERLKNEPFALLGINSDSPSDLPEDATPEERRKRTNEYCKKLFKEQGITWRNAIELDTSGPWPTKWNVSGWPTIYILDAEGRIRFRDLRDHAMEEAVLKLLEEAKQKPGQKPDAKPDSKPAEKAPEKQPAQG